MAANGGALAEEDCDPWGFYCKEVAWWSSPLSAKSVKKQMALDKKREKKWQGMVDSSQGLELFVRKRKSKLKERVRKGVPLQWRRRVWPALLDVEVKPLKHGTVFQGGDDDNEKKSASSLEKGKKYGPASFRAQAQRSLTSYSALCIRTQGKPEAESIFEVIERDLTRTFPKNRLFATDVVDGGRSDREFETRGISCLRRMLRSYAVLDTEVEYCQGMNYVAALVVIHVCDDISLVKRQRKTVVEKVSKKTKKTAKATEAKEEIVKATKKNSEEEEDDDEDDEDEEESPPPKKKKAPLKKKKKSSKKKKEEEPPTEEDEEAPPEEEETEEEEAPAEEAETPSFTALQQTNRQRTDASLSLDGSSEEEAFWLFVAALKSPRTALRELYRPGMVGARRALFVFDKLLKDAAPAIHAHIEKEGVIPDMYATHWLVTVFTAQFPFAFVSRVWDTFLAEGWKPVFKAAIAILVAYEQNLKALPFEQLLTFLKNIPDTLDVDRVLHVADTKVKLTSDQLYKYELQFLKTLEP